MSPGTRMMAFMLMTLGMFMASLDIQIVASSITEIQGGLSATSDEISLIQTSYLIGEVIMIPMSGWLSRMLSTRWLFTLSAVGFTLSSLGCALAWNIQSMVAFRAIQGFLGGAMIPTVFAAGFSMFANNQAKIPAVLGLIATLAPALGPTVGGLITDSLSWRWLFFINLLPGTIISIFIPQLLKIDEPDWSLARQFDVVGAALLAVFLGSLQYFLEEGPKHGWLDDEAMQLWFMTSVIGGACFVWRSLSYREPIVDLKAFADRNFLVGCLLSFVVGVGLYGAIYLTPVFLGQVRGYNALQIGQTVFVVGLFNILATPLTVVLVKKLDVRLVLLAGFSLFGYSCWLFGKVDSTWGRGEVMVPQMMRGLATLMCIIPVTGIALGALKGEQVKGASGLYNLMRNLGGAIGLAAINSELFYNRFSHHVQHLSDQLRVGAVAVESHVAAFEGLVARHVADPSHVHMGALKLMGRLVRREAFVLSVGDVFMMLAAFFACALLLLPVIDARRFHASSTSSDELASH